MIIGRKGLLVFSCIIIGPSQAIIETTGVVIVRSQFKDMLKVVNGLLILSRIIIGPSPTVVSISVLGILFKCLVVISQCFGVAPSVEIGPSYFNACVSPLWG